MKKPRPIIRIPEPCHENWKDMTPTEKGAFCKSCVKEVKDFSRSTDEEIIHALKGSADKVCGRFRREQISPPEPEVRLIDLLPARAGQVAKVAAALAAGFFTSDAVYAQKGEVMLGRIAIQEQPAFLTSSLLKGEVRDEYGRTIGGAVVTVENLHNESLDLETDGEGRFELQFDPEWTPNGLVDISVQCPGYSAVDFKDFKLGKKVIGLQVKMNEERFLVGDVAYMEPSGPIEPTPEKGEPHTGGSDTAEAGTAMGPSSAEQTGNDESATPGTVDRTDPPEVMQTMLLGEPALYEEPGPSSDSHGQVNTDRPIGMIEEMSPIDFHIKSICTETNDVDERTDYITGLMIVHQEENAESPQLAISPVERPVQGPMIDETAPDPAPEDSPVHSTDRAKGIILYPNPASERLFVISATKEPRRFLILDAQGKVVHRGLSSGELSEVDITGFSNGSYLIRMDGDIGVPTVERFMVRR